MNGKDRKIWKAGYDAGFKALIRANEKAFRIGNAILSVLDELYERAE